nr:coilin-like [Nerophis lumbriciformis]
MDAHGPNHIRVRLHFDYPPPAVVDFRMFWLLVDLNKCRIVSDLESTIRDKFEFSRQSLISLFIEDCYLLHTESIHVVRDNDILRVKVECVPHLDGHNHNPNTSQNCKKRRRQSLSEPNNSGEDATCLNKKIKKKSKEILKVDTISLYASTPDRTRWHIHKPQRNDTESASRDYSAMPLLAAPPQVGQKIAFKQLELTENYTPEVSAYKEAMIVSFDPITKQVELELLSVAQAPSEPGKFDLVYQNPDGSELVEYAVSRESRVAERWDSLLEPRLII